MLMGKARLKEFNADGSDSIQPHMFDDTANTLTEEIEELWE